MTDFKNFVPVSVSVIELPGQYECRVGNVVPCQMRRRRTRPLMSAAASGRVCPSGRAGGGPWVL